MKKKEEKYITRGLKVHMRRFVLRRIKDVTGNSGEGIVAEGTQYSDGSVVLVWLTHIKSVTIYANIEAVEQLHGHEHNTIVEWIDKE